MKPQEGKKQNRVTDSFQELYVVSNGRYGSPAKPNRKQDTSISQAGSTMGAKCGEMAFVPETFDEFLHSLETGSWVSFPTCGASDRRLTHLDPTTPHFAEASRGFPRFAFEPGQRGGNIGPGVDAAGPGMLLR